MIAFCPLFQFYVLELTIQLCTYDALEYLVWTFLGYRIIFFLRSTYSKFVFSARPVLLFYVCGLFEDRFTKVRDGDDYQISLSFFFSFFFIGETIQPQRHVLEIEEIIACQD